MSRLSVHRSLYLPLEGAVPTALLYPPPYETKRTKKGRSPRLQDPGPGQKTLKPAVKRAYNDSARSRARRRASLARSETSHRSWHKAALPIS